MNDIANKAAATTTEKTEKTEPVRSVRTNDDGSITIVLHRPVRSMNEVYAELRFREPNARDIIEIGNPITITWDARNNSSVSCNEIVMAKMMARLTMPSPLAEGSVETMKGVDFIRCMTTLQSFFFPRDPTPSQEKS